MNYSANTSRSKFWDLVRGLGILSIVVGHSCGPAIPYVYTYHLAIFFFVSGFLYNGKKYGTDPFGHVSAKLKSAWPKYMFYMTIFILCHNLFENAGINPPTAYYSRSQMLMAIGNSVTFQGAEYMGGAMWFIPLWILSCSVFGGTVWLCGRLAAPIRTAAKADQIPLLVPGAAVLISFFWGICGMFFVFRDLPLSYQFHLALLIQPFFGIGWFLKEGCPHYRRFIKWYGAIPCAIILALWVRFRNLYIDLSLGRIGNGWEYFLLALLGIYCCMWLASIIEKSRLAGGLFSLLGRHSFDIMCLHFLVFKILDLLYGRILLGDSPEIYSAFPQAYSSVLWPLYALAGTCLPALAGAVMEHIRLRLQDSRPRSGKRDS